MNRLYSSKLWLAAAFGLLLLFSSCSATQSLQEYYVDNAQNPNFLAVDVPANILKLEETDLGETEMNAMRSVRKLNILAFRLTENNEAEFQVERNTVKAILKNEKYKELMKLNTKYGKGVIKYLGDEDAIDEVIIYGDNTENGFALIRILGKDMNPVHFAQLMQSLEQDDFDTEGLSQLRGIFKG
jgi:hypothetical protein